jgi:hypothetical protein
MFWAIYTLNTKGTEDQTKHLDTNLVLRCDRVFIQMNDMCRNIIQMQLDMVNYLSSKRIYVQRLFGFNEDLMAKDNELLRLSRHFLREHGRTLPTLIYQTIILYYSWIRRYFDFKNEIFKDYQKRLLSLEYTEVTLKDITPFNILQETVAMQVSLQSDDYGNIMQVSPDYFMYLGE